MADFYYVADTLENFIDDKTLLTSNNSYELLREYKTKQGLLKFVRDKFVLAHKEYILARTDYAEYFNGVSNEDIKYRIRCYQRIIEDIDAVVHNKKATKNKIMKRASSEKKVAKVTYCQNDDDLKIQSADPVAIIGAKAVVLYNRRRKRLIKLVSDSESGLSIKGTTIFGFNLELSGTKTLRKPPIQLQAFRHADRIKRVNILFDDIRGKMFNTSGRLSDDVLIVKVFSA
ncbi:MAG: hypothetical protein HC836_23080 [Richelia sp. RM2_1_2]|nr:hypothetical protein [Richelia sp. RM2_1_2]